MKRYRVDFGYGRYYFEEHADGDWMRYQDYAKQWQPIETAPPSGKWVLVEWLTLTDCALPAYRSDGLWRCPIGSYDGYVEGKQFGRPTRWMPLPELPPPQPGDV